VPARASVKLAARLVPDQSPDTVLEAIKRHGADLSCAAASYACNCHELMICAAVNHQTSCLVTPLFHNGRHAEKCSSALANVTVTQLGFYAWPFHMQRDTLVNRAAAKVGSRLPQVAIAPEMQVFLNPTIRFNNQQSVCSTCPDVGASTQVLEEVLGKKPYFVRNGG
jgi:hypothetical protein